MSRPGSGAASTVPLFGFVALASFGGVAAALVSQHVYRMEPCAWCVLQRLIFVVIGAVALVGLLWPAPPVRRGAGVIALLLALSGLAAALWQHFVAAASASCNLTLADRIVAGTGLDSSLPDVFATRASCADAAVNLLGVPYAFWAAALFVLCALAMLRALRRRG
jgi:disulfide bond formation protein DsbB